MRRMGALALLLMACNPGNKAEPAKPAGKLELRPAAEGDVATLMKSELTRAQSDHKKLLVYVGATWCEPCQRFHAAAKAGRLDADFPNLRLIEFDADRDNERLATAGYVSQYIPAFSVPKPDGNFSGKLIEGSSVKGDGTVADFVTRLRTLL